MVVILMLIRMLIILSLGVALTCATARPCAGQDPLDGPARVFRDDLLDHLVGRWTLTRTIRGKVVENVVDADWVLNHQFLRLTMRDIATPPAYEAVIYIGYDNTSERYVAHWIDVYGGRFSETLGYGKREGNILRWVFEYPDGPFHNTFQGERSRDSRAFVLWRSRRDRSRITLRAPEPREVFSYQAILLLVMFPIHAPPADA
jgi:hypothetical protein